MERAGTPTVVIASAGFEHDILATAEAFGMPTQQFVVVPKVYNNLTVEESIAQTEPVVDELMLLLQGNRDRDAFDGPATNDASDESFTASDGRTSFEVFNLTFAQRNWTDGYPVWPPTPSRVARLLDGVEGRGSDVVCVLPPGNGEATVAKVAANAAMAGCEPEDMPVLMAILRAVAHREQRSVLRLGLMSTSAHAPLVVVNGPVAKQLGINGGRCCVGPGQQNAVNTRISRAFHLCLKNIARWVPGLMDMDSVGTARKNIVVFAENEDESPWEPYHVSQGYAPTDSTVTVFFTSGEWDLSIQGHVDGHQLAKAIASYSGGNNNSYMMGVFGDHPHQVPLGRLLIVVPPHAGPLAEAGFSKQAFERFLWQQGKEPVARLIEPLRKLYADGEVRKEYEWLFDLPPEQQWTERLPVIERPEEYSVVVAGSVRAKNMLMPTRTHPETELVTATPT